MASRDYEGEILLILINILVTSLVCLVFVVCCRKAGVESPKKFSYRDGEQDSDELPDLLPNGEERDGCWLDFEAKTWVNPKGTVLHLTQTCGHLSLGRCKELGVCLDCLDRLKKPKGYVKPSTRTPHGRRRTSMRG